MIQLHGTVVYSYSRTNYNAPDMGLDIVYSQRIQINSVMDRMSQETVFNLTATLGYICKTIRQF